MSHTSIQKGITLKYVREFKCIGPDCPDNCCHGWNVGMERGTYDNLKQVLPHNQFKSSIKKEGNNKSAYHAVIMMKEDGSCPFLDTSDLLCNIHKRYGESYLSVICRQYPRQVSMIGEIIQLGLTLSCPEAARLCLLDDAAADLVEFDPAPLLNSNVSFYHSQSATPANPYLGYVNDFREIMLQLLANRNFPFDSRLFISLYFAKQVSQYVYEGAREIDESKIVHELELMLTPGYMDDLHSEYVSLPQSSEFSMSLLQTIIMGRISHKGILSQLIAAILEENDIKAVFTSNNIELTADIGMNEAFENMLTHYQQRRDLLLNRYGAIVDQYFENYSKNFWFKDLFIKSPSLLNHMQNLIVRVAVLKFLFFCHPDLNSLIESPETLSPEEIKERLDTVAINAFYRFSRGIEHDQEFLAKIHSELGKQEMDSFAHLVVLLKF